MRRALKIKEFLSRKELYRWLQGGIHTASVSGITIVGDKKSTKDIKKALVGKGADIEVVPCLTLDDLKWAVSQCDSEMLYIIVDCSGFDSLGSIVNSKIRYIGVDLEKNLVRY